MFKKLQRSRWLRRLQRFHRIAGASSAVIVLIWFLSGVVMLFHRYPKLSDAERRTLVEPLGAPSRLLSPAELAQRGLRLPLKARLQRTLGGDPVYFFTQNGERRAISAKDGSEQALVTPEEALAFVRRHWPDAKPRWLETRSEPDAWTVHSRFRAYFPLHIIEVGDADRHLIHVSERTGEAVQLSSASERIWAYLGAIPHWVYFTPLRRHPLTWRYLVIVVSLFAMFAALAGWLLGIARTLIAWNRTRSLTPFKTKQSFRIHHLSGLVFGPFVVTWLLSGAFSLISLSPDKSDPRHPDHWRKRLVSAQIGPQAFDLPTRSVLIRCAAEMESIRTVEFRVLGDRAYYLCLGTEESRRFVWSEGDELQLAKALPRRIIEALAERMPSPPAAIVQSLPSGDNYVFQRRHAKAVRGLYRISTPDDSSPRIYVSASDAKIIALHDTRARVQRWLYHGLHNLDLRPLYDHGEVWLVVILFLLAGGTSIGVTATRLSTRSLSRVRKTRRRHNSN